MNRGRNMTPTILKIGPITVTYTAEGVLFRQGTARRKNDGSVIYKNAGPVRARDLPSLIGEIARVFRRRQSASRGKYPGKDGRDLFVMWENWKPEGGLVFWAPGQERDGGWKYVTTDTFGNRYLGPIPPREIPKLIAAIAGYFLFERGQ